MADMLNFDMDGFDASDFEDPLGDQLEVVKLVVFLIDCSASMEGKNIGTVNALMEELLDELKAPQIHIAVAEITSEVQWRNPVAGADFGTWDRLKGDSLTHLGDAWTQLTAKLSDDQWCPKGTKRTEMNFILFSDGYSTDESDAALKALNQVEAFANGKKLACTLSDIVDMETIKGFIGSTGTHIELNQNVLAIKEQIVNMIG